MRLPPDVKTRCFPIAQIAELISFLRMLQHGDNAYECMLSFFLGETRLLPRVRISRNELNTLRTAEVIREFE